jgi:hypothetical protein
MNIDSERMPPALVRGPAARTLVRFSTVAFFAAVAAVSVLVLCVLFGLEPLKRIAMPCVGVTVLLTAGWRGAAVVVAWREGHHGYTTLADRDRDLWQLEPGTGTPLRRPGEPYSAERTSA